MSNEEEDVALQLVRHSKTIRGGYEVSKYINYDTFVSVGLVYLFMCVFVVKQSNLCYTNMVSVF